MKYYNDIIVAYELFNDVNMNIFAYNFQIISYWYELQYIYIQVWQIWFS